MLVFVLGTTLYASCASPDGARPFDSDERLGATASALSGSGRVICELMDATPAFSIGSVSVDKPSCNFTDYDNLYYLGSVRRTRNLRPGARVAPRQRLPEATRDAMYCALKESHGLLADATTVTNVGRFGLTSRIEVTNADFGQKLVSLQRVARVYAFGVGMDLEVHALEMTFPQETAASSLGLSLTSDVGYYARLKSSTTSWSLSGSGSLPPFALGLSMGQDAKFESENTRGFAFSTTGPVSQSNTPAPRYLYDNVFAPVTCDPGAIICVQPSPTAEQSAAHDCPECSDGFFRDLNDGDLPFVGAYGGRGRYLYSTYDNWTHLGYVAKNPASTIAEAQSGEPFQGDVATWPTSHLDMELGFEFIFLKMMLALDVKYKNGFAIRQNMAPDPRGAGEFPPPVGMVATYADAASTAKLTAHVVVDFPFPFIDHPIVDLTFDLINLTEPKAAPANEGAYVSYDGEAGFPFVEYTTPSTGRRRGAEAATAHDACVAVPATHPGAVPASSKDFVSQVAMQAETSYHPCHVYLCKPDNPSNPAGSLHRERCEWNAATKKLDCGTIAGACRGCDQTADICDSSGHVYHPKSKNISPRCPAELIQ